MKAAVLHNYDSDLRKKELLVYEDIDSPQEPGRGEVIVKIKAAGVCRTDLHIITGRDLGIPLAKLPFVLGHENAGEVYSIGEGVNKFIKGDKVLCYPFLTSGISTEERYGIDSHTLNRKTPGINVNGGFCELTKFSERSLIKVDQKASLTELAPLGDAGITAYGAIRKLMGFIRPQDRVLVIGIGGVGHLGIQLLLRLTPGKIIAVDPREEARTLANSLGITECYESLDQMDDFKALNGNGFRAVLDFFGESDIPNQAIGLLNNQGRYLAIGTGGEVRVSTAELVAREIRIIGSFVGNFTDLVEVTNLTVRGDLISKVSTYPMNEVNRALHDLRDGKILGRAVLVPN